MTIQYVLDTNAVSAIMKNEPRIITRVRSVGPDELGIPQPVLAEIAYGIERLPRSKRRDAFTSQFERIRAVFQRVAWTDDVSVQFGQIKAQLERTGRRLEDFDSAIAAHAVSLDAVLVTANLGQMSRVPHLRVEDWS